MLSFCNKQQYLLNDAWNSACYIRAMKNKLLQNVENDFASNGTNKAALVAY